MFSDYGENLRYCCDHFRSISVVCRRLNINRQQFNKYINGHSQPSRHNHKRISDFFGLDDHELFLPHAEFTRIFNVRLSSGSKSEVGLDVARQIIDTLSANSAAARPYAGLYYKYFYSMSEPDKIRRDLCLFRMNSGVLCTSTKERVIATGTRRSTRRLLTYRGTVGLLGGRMFWVECDRELQAEVTLTILFPSPTKVITQLEGLVLGTGLDRARRIVASRIVLERLDHRTDPREALANVAIMEISTAAIPGEVRAALLADQQPESRYIQVLS